MLQKFQTLSRPFIITTLTIVAINCTLAYWMISTLTPGSSRLFHAIAALILAVIVLPIILFVAAGLIVLLGSLGSQLLVRLGVRPRPLPFLNRHRSSIGNDTLALALQQSYQTQPVAVPADCLAVTDLEKSKLAFGLSLLFQGKQLAVFGFGNYFLVRCGVNLPTVPSLILNSRLNDAAQSSIDTHRPGVSTVDLGSDFGKYFKLSFVKGGEVDALQIVDPRLMLTLLEAYTAYDISVSQAAIDFKFSGVPTVEAFVKVLETTCRLADIISDAAAKKANRTIDSLAAIKRSCAAIQSVTNWLFAIIVVGFIGLVLMIFVFDGVDKIDPGGGALKLILLMITLGFMLIIVLVVALLTYVLLVSLVSSALIKLYINASTRRAQQAYARIRLAYTESTADNRQSPVT